MTYPPRVPNSRGEFCKVEGHVPEVRGRPDASAGFQDVMVVALPEDGFRVVPRQPSQQILQRQRMRDTVSLDLIAAIDLKHVDNIGA